MMGQTETLNRIPSRDPFPRKRVAVLDSEMAYIETGESSGPTIVFLHGNPTSSYLWRNVIPHVASLGRALAPDLIGMGQSGPAAGGAYRFADHARYLDAWFETVAGDGPVVIVSHDWGGALGFHWARRNASRIAGIAYMETIVQAMSWDDWPDDARSIFQGFRSPKGEELVLEKNFFVEKVLPASVLRGLTPREMEVYRLPYMEPGESRRPTLTWPREIPIDGEPADVAEIVAASGRWLETAEVPKLFVNADPGSILVGPQREYCRSWPNQKEVTVEGMHFIQEDSPAEIGEAVAAFVRGLTI